MTEAMTPERANQLAKVLEFRETIQDIHPFLERVFPIAIVEGDRFLIYDVGPSGQTYELVGEALTPMPVPEGVRAAFELESFGNRMACVVTGEVFDDLFGYATIFHEFIHCRQMETCERELKQQLGIARKAQAAGDHMWEIDHPFPYADAGFEEIYTALLAANEASEIAALHRRLKADLSVDDYEYTIWQEWKEGFARYIENRIRREWRLQEIVGSRKPPFSRVAFYAGGARYIELLGAQEPELITDIERLFARML